MMEISTTNFTTPEPYLEAISRLISRLMMGIIRVIRCVIGVTNLLTKSP